MFCLLTLCVSSEKIRVTSSNDEALPSTASCHSKAFYNRRQLQYPARATQAGYAALIKMQNEASRRSGCVTRASLCTIRTSGRYPADVQDVQSPSATVQSAWMLFQQLF